MYKRQPDKMYKIKNKKIGELLVALAGPFANIVLALFLKIIMVLLYKYTGILATEIGETVLIIISSATKINIGLAVFNLLPIPPLDGYNVIKSIIPKKAADWIDNNMQIIEIAFLFLIFSGLTTRVTIPTIAFLESILDNIVLAIF